MFGFAMRSFQRFPLGRHVQGEPNEHAEEHESLVSIAQVAPRLHGLHMPPRLWDQKPRALRLVLTRPRRQEPRARHLWSTPSRSLSRATIRPAPTAEERSSARALAENPSRRALRSWPMIYPGGEGPWTPRPWKSRALRSRQAPSHICRSEHKFLYALSTSGSE